MRLAVDQLEGRALWWAFRVAEPGIMETPRRLHGDLLGAWNTIGSIIGEKQIELLVKDSSIPLWTASMSFDGNRFDVDDPNPIHAAVRCHLWHSTGSDPRTLTPGQLEQAFRSTLDTAAFPLDHSLRAGHPFGWDAAGPVLDRDLIQLRIADSSVPKWVCDISHEGETCQAEGLDPIEAIIRCHLRRLHGDTLDVPDEILHLAPPDGPRAPGRRPLPRL